MHRNFLDRHVVQHEAWRHRLRLFWHVRRFGRRSTSLLRRPHVALPRLDPGFPHLGSGVVLLQPLRKIACHALFHRRQDAAVDDIRAGALALTAITNRGAP